MKIHMRDPAHLDSNTLAHGGKQFIDCAHNVCVLNQTRCSTVASSVSVADTPATRRRGLLGRPVLEQHEGLWIVPCESVHTFGMSYPIDLAYLDRARRVVKIVESLQPCRLSMCLRAHSVMELAAGAVRLSGTRIGHQLGISPLLQEPI